MLLAETFLDVFWWMVVAFFWLMFLWVFVALVGDLFRRHDMTGWAKAGWLLLLFVLPLVGALLYVIARPRVTSQDIRAATELEAARRAVAGVSTADELAKLGELRSQGVLDDQEYEELKRRTLATA